MSIFTQKPSQSIWQIYRWPVLVNGIGLLGLLAALIGNGWMDVLSWLCLGGIVVLMIYAYSNPKGDAS